MLEMVIVIRWRRKKLKCNRSDQCAMNSLEYCQGAIDVLWNVVRLLFIKSCKL